MALSLLVLCCSRDFFIRVGSQVMTLELVDIEVWWRCEACLRHLGVQVVKCDCDVTSGSLSAFCGNLAQHVGFERIWNVDRDYTTPIVNIRRSRNSYKLRSRTCLLVT